MVFQDDCFSFDRLKSFFYRMLCLWASMIPNVDSSFVICLLWFGGLVRFCLSPLLRISFLIHLGIFSFFPLLFSLLIRL